MLLVGEASIRLFDVFACDLVDLGFELHFEGLTERFLVLHVPTAIFVLH